MKKVYVFCAVNMVEYTVSMSLPYTSVESCANAMTTHAMQLAKRESYDVVTSEEEFAIKLIPGANNTPAYLLSAHELDVGANFFRGAWQKIKARFGQSVKK